MKKQIIVCDDDESILEVIQVILEEAGFNVLAYSNASNILEDVQKYQPDLIMLDIWMPKLDAKEAVKILRSNESSKNIPIILISALNQGEAISKELQVQGFLKKPFDIESLTAIVKKLVS